MTTNQRELERLRAELAERQRRIEMFNARIGVVEACERGERIEYICCDPDGRGWTVNESPEWVWGSFDYRIAPKPREWPAYVNAAGDLVVGYINPASPFLFTPIYVREVLPESKP